MNSEQLFKIGATIFVLFAMGAFATFHFYPPIAIFLGGSLCALLFVIFVFWAIWSM
jgi:hypothetical protein